MGGTLSCIKDANGQSKPQVKISVRTSCCNSHKLKFFVDKKMLEKFLQHSLLYSADPRETADDD